MTAIDLSISRPPGKQARPETAKIVFHGVLFDVWQWDQTLFDGTTAVFETLQRPDTVLVLPVIDNDHVILAEETQPSMQAVVHAIGGRVEDKESPLDAVRRELLEEAGYTAREWRLWDAWQPITKIDWAVYLFVAHSIEKVSQASLDVGEKISLRRIPISSLLDGNANISLDDYELLFKLNFARSNDEEHGRVLRLLTP